MHILIVDNDSRTAWTYAHILESEGFSTSVALTLDEAQASLQIACPDILLLDRDLPDGDGSDLCQQIKTDPNSSPIYIILISGLMATEFDQISSLEIGADDYLIKPISAGLLLARVRAAVRIRSAQEEVWAAYGRLQDHNEAFRALVENTPDVVARHDKDVRLLYVNSRVEALMGISPAKVIGKTHRELPVDEDLRDLWDAAVIEVLTTKRQLQIEFAMSVRGQVRYFEANLAPEFNAAAEVQTVLSVTRDVTRRVEAEADKLRLATVVDQAVEAITIADLDNRITYANQAMLRTSGYSWEELKGQPMRILRSGMHTQEFYADLDRSVCSQSRWRGRVINRRKDGSLYYDEISIFPVTDRYGRMISMASVRRDVTEQVRMERQREAMVSLAAALRQTDTRRDILAVTTEQVRHFLQAESTAVALVEGEGGEAVVASAQGDFASLLDSRLGMTDSVTGYVLATGEPYLNNEPAIDPRLRFQAQNTETKAVAAVPLIVQHRIIGVLWAGRSKSIDESDLHVLSAMGDIAANSLYRADLYAQSLEYAARLEDRVAERTRQLEEANAELQVLDEMKSKFVSDISHELRTPLASMTLYLELLEKGKPEKHQQYRRSLHQMLDRLTQLVEDILDLSRLETRSLLPQMLQPVDLNAIVEQMVDVFRPRAEAVGLDLFFLPAPTLPPLLGDSTQISRLVSNLLANAINYTPRGAVTVSTAVTPEPGNVCLMVQDTGVGIAESDLPFVVDRFYRGQHEGLGIPGIGLGLTIVKEIADMHGGQLHIDSEMDQGTTVTVSFPPAALSRS